MSAGRYTSFPTRFFSFDQFLGEGKIDASQPETSIQPSDGTEDLRAKFGSNIPVRDMPTTFGLRMARRSIMGKKV